MNKTKLHFLGCTSEKKVRKKSKKYLITPRSCSKNSCVRRENESKASNKSYSNNKRRLEHDNFLSRVSSKRSNVAPMYTTLDKSGQKKHKNKLQLNDRSFYLNQ